LELTLFEVDTFFDAMMDGEDREQNLLARIEALGLRA
jgi:hypothetical protein